LEEKNHEPKHGKVTRGYLGVVIQNVTPALAKAFDVPQVTGVLVSDVNKNGPGQQAVIVLLVNRGGTTSFIVVGG
jgi:S1-C subfamily serine protease